MKRKRWIAGAVAAVAVAGAGLAWQQGLLPTAMARVEAATFSQRVRLLPYGLVASAPSSFVCMGTTCSGPRLPNGMPVQVSWRIAPATGRELPRSGEGSVTDRVVTNLTLAGFEGFIAEWGYSRGKGGGFGCEFKGWLHDPSRGLLRLHISGGEDVGCDAPNLLAVIVSTRGEGALLPNTPTPDAGQDDTKR